MASWPARVPDRCWVRWNFWWQAQLLDCAVDAWLRLPDGANARVVHRLIKSVRWRNFGRFTNDYYDDMAWMGLALRRAESLGADGAVGIRRIVTKILDARSALPPAIPWRMGDDYCNAPANGPAAILLARTGFRRRAAQLADWMDTALRLPGSDLIADGVYPGRSPEPVYYTYVQGVVMGARVELAKAGGSRSEVHRLVAAVDHELTRDGALRGQGGGDGGLFAGILARYLALVSLEMPGDQPADRLARATAARLVLQSAEAAWNNRVEAPYGPLFGPDWTRPALLPARGGVLPERDLSVQLSGWMLMEAAALLARRPPERSPDAGTLA